jgi:hypothetical protein
MYQIVNRRIVCKQIEGYPRVDKYEHGGCLTAKASV